VKLAWSAAVIVPLVALEYALSRPSGGCGPNPDAYCAFAAGPEEETTTFLEMGVFLVSLFVWALGMIIIGFIARLVEERSDRREIERIAAGNPKRLAP
jgi:hypothetical protein